MNMTGSPLAKPYGEVLHWYDFICPFCYLAQPENEALITEGWSLTEMSFSAHPEIPEGGVTVAPRTGAMYVSIEETADRLGLPLRWPQRLPSSRLALGAAEWIRLHAADSADAFRKAVSAHTLRMVGISVIGRF